MSGQRTNSGAPRLTWGVLALLAPLVSGCGLWNTTLAPQAAITVSARCEKILAPQVPATLGYEDLDRDPASGAVYASGADWRGAIGGSPARGVILKITQTASGAAWVVDVTPELPISFFPHGLDLYRSPDGRTARLFVVNHADQKASRIEVFDLQPDGALAWSSQDSRAWPGLSRPNDVAAVGLQAFYATDDHKSARHGWSPGLGEILEDAIAARSAKVVYVDIARGEARTAVKAAFPNGIQLSSDAKTLFVSELTRGAVRVFKVGRDGALQPTGRLRAGRMPDNLYLQDDRWLWVAAHGDALSFRDHALSWKKPDGRHPPSPGRLMVFDLQAPDAAPRIVYATTKTTIADGDVSAASVGAPNGQTFWMGSIFEGLWQCGPK